MWSELFSKWLISYWSIYRSEPFSKWPIFEVALFRTEKLEATYFSKPSFFKLTNFGSDRFQNGQFSKWLIFVGIDFEVTLIQGCPFSKWLNSGWPIFSKWATLKWYFEFPYKICSILSITFYLNFIRIKRQGTFFNFLFFRFFIWTRIFRTSSFLWFCKIYQKYEKQAHFSSIYFDAKFLQLILVMNITGHHLHMAASYHFEMNHQKIFHLRIIDFFKTQFSII